MTRLQELRDAYEQAITDAVAAAYPLSAKQDLVLARSPFTQKCKLIKTKHTKDGEAQALVEMSDGERHWVKARTVMLQSSQPVVIEALRAYNYYRFTKQGEHEGMDEISIKVKADREKHGGWWGGGMTFTPEATGRSEGKADV